MINQKPLDLNKSLLTSGSFGMLRVNIFVREHIYTKTSDLFYYDVFNINKTIEVIIV